MKKKRNNISKIWTWLSFVVFALIILLMGTALVKKQSPEIILQSLFATGAGNSTVEDFSELSKEQLIDRASVLQIEVDSLKGVINDYKERFGFASAIVSVDNKTLNMRSKPSLKGKIIFRIPNKSSVAVIEYDTEEKYIDGAKGRWCKVNYAGSKGWVWGNYLKMEH